jgi:3-oxoacyl-[acyl-carrier-protein] synthase-3
VTNDDLIARYGMDTDHEWIVKRTGIEARRFADEGVGSSDLAVHASKQAIEAAGISQTDLDLILFASLSPDMCFPGSGVFLQRKLGLCDGNAPKFVPAMDIKNQCSGFLYGLATANAFVRSGVVVYPWHAL